MYVWPQISVKMMMMMVVVVVVVVVVNIITIGNT